MLVIIKGLQWESPWQISMYNDVRINTLESLFFNLNTNLVMSQNISSRSNF